MGALPLGIFEQPEERVFFSNLLNHPAVYTAEVLNRGLPNMESRISSDTKEQAGQQARTTQPGKRTVALFYCQNTPESGEAERQALEKKYASRLKLFPIPCSGRLDPLHLLKALEEFADAAYVIACPEGACRYFEGNTRAMKRVAMTAQTIAQIGLEKERVGIVANSKENPKTLAKLAEEILER
ncbi:Methyl-viologen-reducing hydrogenase, delta subunit, partial [sediment metagenome]